MHGVFQCLERLQLVLHRVKVLRSQADTRSRGIQLDHFKIMVEDRCLAKLHTGQICHPSVAIYSSVDLVPVE